MRSSCVSPKDFKATAPESKQHRASCTRANSQWREKRSSEKIRKRDLSPRRRRRRRRKRSRKRFRADADVYAAQTNCFVYPGKHRGVPDLSSGTLCTRARSRPGRGAFFFFLFFSPFETQSSCVLCSVRYNKRSLFPPHAEWRACYIDTKV